MRYVLAVVMLCVMSQAQELRRPTADADAGTTAVGCSGTAAAGTTLPNAYDAAGLTTSSTLAATGTTTQSIYKARKLMTWQAASGSYSALSLNINSSSAGNSGGAAANACLAYSTNSGSTWTSIRCDSGAGWTQSTNVLSLSAAQDLSKLLVGVCASGIHGDKFGTVAGNDSVTIFDVWTLGTTAAAAAGNGNSSGVNSRNIIFVF